MDAQYLKDTVGDALIESLNEVIEKRPADPIEYVALMLLKYLDNQYDLPEEVISMRHARREMADIEKSELKEKCTDAVTDASLAPGEIKPIYDEVPPKVNNTTEKPGANPVPESAEVETESKVAGEEGDKIKTEAGQGTDGQELGKEREDISPAEGVADIPDSNQLNREEGDNAETKAGQGTDGQDLSEEKGESAKVGAVANILGSSQNQLNENKGDGIETEPERGTNGAELSKDKGDFTQPEGVANIPDSNNLNRNEEKDTVIEGTNDKAEIIPSDEPGVDRENVEGDGKVDSADVDERSEDPVNGGEPAKEESPAEAGEEPSPPQDSKE